MNNKIEVIGTYFCEENQNVHLLEFRINELANMYRVDDFTQEDKTLDKSEWQVAYDEYYLDEDGTEIIGDFYKKPDAQFKIHRIVFFFYYLNINEAFNTPFGKVKLMKPIMMPERLKKIIKFEEID